MNKLFMALVGLVIWLPSFAGGIEQGRAPVVVDCKVIAPTQEITREVEIKAQADVDAIVKKILNAGASAKYTQEDMKRWMPNSDKVIEKQLRAYLLCVAMQQDPARAADVVELFFTELLPQLDRRAGQKLAPSLPKNGKVILQSEQQNLFESGTLSFQITPKMEALDETSRKISGLSKKDPLEQWQVPMDIIYRPVNGEAISRSTVFVVKQKRTFYFGGHGFSMTLLDVYDGNNAAAFLVQATQ